MIHYFRTSEIASQGQYGAALVAPALPRGFPGDGSLLGVVLGRRAVAASAPGLHFPRNSK